MEETKLSRALSLYQELRRKTFHFSVLVALPFLVYLSTRTLIRIAALCLLITGVLYWYIDHRYLRRTKFREAMAGWKELFGKRLEEHEVKNLDQLEEAEEKTIRSLVKNFLRPDENRYMLPTFYFFLGALLALVFFGKEPLAFGIIAISIGDSFSTLVGKHWGGHKIFYNREKSWEGFFAFVVSVLVASYVFAYLVPSFVIINLFAVLAVTAVVGALIESVPTISDNLTIPLGVGFVLWLAGLI